MSRDGGEHPAARSCFTILHFRQHYALSTSDDPGNAKWKQRSSCGFPGKIMLYSRQRYALNHIFVVAVMLIVTEPIASAGSRANKNL